MIPGLGDFGGFEFWLEDRKAAGTAGAVSARMGALVGKAAQEPGRAGRAAATSCRPRRS